jgi:AcrR family transcriptional regulator
MRVKTEEKRHAIMDVASAVFREKGYAAASMAEISARLGGSKGTLYSYFTSKDELFSAVMLELATKLGLPTLFDELDQAPDTQAALRVFVHELVRVLASAPIVDFRRMVIAEAARSELGKLVYENGAALYWRRFADFYAAQVRKGLFRKADPWRAAMHIDGLCMAGPVQQLLEGAIDHVSDEELDAAADAAVDVFLRAYALEISTPREGRLS